MVGWPDAGWGGGRAVLVQLVGKFHPRHRSFPRCARWGLLTQYWTAAGRGVGSILHGDMGGKWSDDWDGLCLLS